MREPDDDRREVGAHQSPARDRILPVQREHERRDEQVGAVDRQREPLQRIVPDEGGGQGNARDQQQIADVDPEEPPVGAGDEVILVVLAHPEDAQVDEADDVRQHLRREVTQRGRQLGRGHLRGRGDRDVEDEDGHRDGEDAVAERGHAGGAQRDETIAGGSLGHGRLPSWSRAGGRTRELAPPSCNSLPPSLSQRRLGALEIVDVVPVPYHFTMSPRSFRSGTARRRTHR